MLMKGGCHYASGLVLGAASARALGQLGCAPRLACGWRVMSRLALRLHWEWRGCVRAAWVFSLVDEHHDFARELGRTDRARGHPGGPRGRHHRVEPWYVPGLFGNLFMHHIETCVGV